MENERKAPCFSQEKKMLYSEREEISTGLIPRSHKSSVQTHTHSTTNAHTPTKKLSPPVHEQAFNLSQLGQKHADLFPCQ